VLSNTDLQFFGYSKQTKERKSAVSLIFANYCASLRLGGWRAALSAVVGQLKRLSATGESPQKSAVFPSPDSLTSWIRETGRNTLDTPSDFPQKG